MADGTSNSWNFTYKYNASDDLNIDSDNDTSEFYWAHPVHVHRVGCIVTTAVANAAGTVDVEIYKQNQVGDNGLDTLLGTWRITDTTTRAVGSVHYCKMVDETSGSGEETAEDGADRNVAPSKEQAGGYAYPVILPGQSLVLKVVEPADSGVVIPFVEASLMPVNVNDADVVAFESTFI